ncbi:MAG: threonylcarbamoyl-AMP synthase [Actinobacteria bacterium]|nr:threonylcarbamoyl-AMP synthase [Actinomycetota bacterium]
MKEIVKLDLKNFDYVVKKASDVLIKGGLVILPTETVYGLAACFDNPYAIEKIFIAKERSKDIPLVVCIGEFEQLKILTDDISKITRKIIKKFWPGPLTVVLNKSKAVSSLLTAGKNTVGVRYPKNDLVCKIIDSLGLPLVVTSANLSGSVSPKNFSEIEEKLLKQADFSIDGGATDIGVVSTIVDLTTDKPSILRKGAVSVEEINKILKIG